MSDIIREPDELWTSYLIRRLEAERMRFSEFRIDASEHECIRYFSKGGMKEKFLLSIYREVHPATSDSLLLKRAQYSGQKDLATLSEEIELADYDQDQAINIIFFDSENCCLSGASSKAMIQHCLPGYEKKENYNADRTMDALVKYILTLKPTSGFPEPPEEVEPSSSLKEKTAPTTPTATKQQDPRLDEILQTVRRLEQIAAEHPLIMQSEEAYLRKLYVDTINRNVNALHVFEYQGRRIPYVLVESSAIEGNVGKPHLNLYFVARDIATEEWQQRIVAVHESLCAKKSHAAAGKEEKKVARLLGKEKEWRAWRKAIDGRFK